jgi:hypothetical protein
MPTETSKDFRTGWSDCATVIDIAFDMMKAKNPAIKDIIELLQKQVITIKNQPPRFTR